MLRPGAEDTWSTSRVPRGCAAGDRLFCWESTPSLRVVGLAVVTKMALGEKRRSFGVRYLTTRFASMPTISELRLVPLLNEASFLKRGPATTLFPLSAEQATILLSILATRNPGVSRLWRDVRIAPWSGLVPDVDSTVVGLEGGAKLVSHFIRERSRSIVEAKKGAVRRSTGTLACEVCGFDFATVYPRIGDDFCEVHHRTPLSRLNSTVATRLSDLAVVCSNCHRMLHRTVPFGTVEALQRKLRKRRR
jgi:hypothetical protein